MTPGEVKGDGRSRREELAANLAVLEERLVAAARAAGRDRDELTLVAVTKTFPASDVLLLAELGIVDFGENRDQEAAAKVVEVAAAIPPVDGLVPRWHFVGRLQRNKAASVAGYAALVHSVDRAALADALGRAAQRAGRELPVLIQVSLDVDDRPADGVGTAGRGGAAPAAVPALAERIAGAAGLRLAGVMAVAPQAADTDDAFDRLATVAGSVRAVVAAAEVISAGMSGDLEAAVRHGATHVRVGTALLGSRPLMSDHVRRTLR